MKLRCIDVYSYICVCLSQGCFGILYLLGEHNCLRLFKGGGSFLGGRHTRVFGYNPWQKRNKGNDCQLHHVPPSEYVPNARETGEDCACLHANEVVRHEADEHCPEEGTYGHTEDAATHIDGPVGRHGEYPQEEEEVGAAVRVLAQAQAKALDVDGHERGNVLG